MQQKVNKIYNGSNIDVLKGFQDNSCDALITDVPYGLQDVNALEFIKDNKNGTQGFMGKKINRFYA